MMQRLRELASQVAEREGCKLYDIEYVGGSRGQGRVVRVFIDKEPTGASIDDCSNVSRGLNLLLDVEDVIPGGAYSLEVSTPGLDRLLREAWHFAAAAGKKIWVKTSSSMEEARVRKQATGTLEGVDGDKVRLTVDNQVLEIPLAIVERARVVVEWNEPKGKEPKGPKKKKKK
jgi:ribosome maturation factor RimP